MKNNSTINLFEINNLPQRRGETRLQWIKRLCNYFHKKERMRKYTLYFFGEAIKTKEAPPVDVRNLFEYFKADLVDRNGKSALKLISDFNIDTDFLGAYEWAIMPYLSLIIYPIYDQFKFDVPARRSDLMRLLCHLLLQHNYDIDIIIKMPESAPIVLKEPSRIIPTMAADFKKPQIFEALYMAANLLIPDWHFNTLSTHERDIDLLSSLYWVSKELASIKLYEGDIQNET